MTMRDVKTEYEKILGYFEENVRVRWNLNLENLFLQRTIAALELSFRS